MVTPGNEGVPRHAYPVEVGEVARLFDHGIGAGTFGLLGTSVLGIRVLTQTGQLPGLGRDDSNIRYVIPDGETHEQEEWANEQARRREQRDYVLGHAVSPVVHAALREISDESMLTNALDRLSSLPGSVGRVATDGGLCAGVIVGISKEVRRLPDHADPSNPLKRLVIIPGGLPQVLLTGIEPRDKVAWFQVASLFEEGS